MFADLCVAANKNGEGNYKTLGREEKEGNSLSGFLKGNTLLVAYVRNKMIKKLHLLQVTAWEVKVWQLHSSCNLQLLHTLLLSIQRQKGASVLCLQRYEHDSFDTLHPKPCAFAAV